MTDVPDVTGVPQQSGLIRVAGVRSSAVNRLQIADTLDQAAEVLETRGWTQLSYYDELTHAVCAAGAINTVVHNHPVMSGYTDDLCVKEELLEHLGVELVDEDGEEAVSSDDYDHRIAVWNDDPERTAEDVVRTLRSLAGILRKAVTS